MPFTVDGPLFRFLFNKDFPPINVGNEVYAEYQPDSPAIIVTGSAGFTDLAFGDGFAQTQGFFTPPPAVDPQSIVFRAVRSRIAARYSGSVVVEILDGPFVPPSTANPPQGQSQQSQVVSGSSNPIASPTQANPDLQSFVATWNAIKIAPDATDQWLPVIAGWEARLDIISQVSYGRSDLWWAIALANDIINPFERPMSGDKLRIPTLSRILRVFGQVGTGTELTSPYA